MQDNIAAFLLHFVCTLCGGKIKHSSVWFCVCLTLRLHACSDEGERVGCQLTAGAGHRAAAHQHQDARVGRALRVPLQPGVLQRLREETVWERALMKESFSIHTRTHAHSHSHTHTHTPRRRRGLCRHRGWCPACWVGILYKTPKRPPSAGSA